MKHIYLFFIFTFITTNLYAEERKVNFSFEPVPGAQNYEIEIYLFEKDEPIFLKKHKTDTPSWNGELETGIYQFRLRSLDYRQIPGEWSEFVKFNVALPKPVIVRPLKDEVIQSNSFDLEEILFQWVPVRNVSYYHLIVKTVKGEIIFDEVISTPQKFINLKVGESYQWSVVSSDGNKSNPKDLEFETMILQGAPLDSPEINIEVTDSRFIVNWTNSSKVESFEYKMFKMKNDSEDWISLASKKNYKKNKIFFIREKLANYQYRFEVTAIAKGFAPSPLSRIDFVWNGQTVKIIEKQKVDREQRDNSFLLRPHLWTISLLPEIKKTEFTNKVASTDTEIQNSLTSQFVNLNITYEKKRSNLFYEINSKYGNYLTKTQRFEQFDYSLSTSYNFKRTLFSFRVGAGLSYFSSPFITGDAVAKTFEYSSSTYYAPLIFINFTGKIIAKSAWGYSLQYLVKPILFSSSSKSSPGEKSSGVFPNSIAHAMLTNQISDRFSLTLGLQLENIQISNDYFEQNMKSYAIKAGVIYSF